MSDQIRPEPADLSAQAAEPEQSLAEIKEQLQRDRQMTDRAMTEAIERLARAEEQAQAAAERAKRAEQLLDEAIAEQGHFDDLKAISERIVAAEERRDRATERAWSLIDAINSGDQDRLVELRREQALSLPPVIAVAARREPEGAVAPEKPRVAASAPDVEAAVAATAADDDKSGACNLNDARYEDLRAAGLDVGEAGRVLAARESKGGFSVLAEVAQVHGLSDRAIAAIESNFSI